MSELEVDTADNQAGDGTQADDMGAAGDDQIAGPDVAGSRGFGTGFRRSGAPGCFPWGTGNPTFYLTGLAIVAIVGIVVVAWNHDVAAAVLVGSASFFVGGANGFIFGIPRYAASPAERVADESEPGVVKYRANTNLEQISDWLTKILVGLGLTQFRAIGAFFADLSERVGEALASPDDPATTVAAGLLLLTAITGFIFFYLWSRVYLPNLFRDAERTDADSR